MFSALVDRLGSLAHLVWHRLVSSRVQVLRTAGPMASAQAFALIRLAHLRQRADRLLLKRPRGWEPRSRRLYAGVVRRLALQSPSVDARELPRQAAQALFVAQRPFRELLSAALTLVTTALSAAAVVMMVAALISPGVRRWVWPPDYGRFAHWEASSAVEQMPRSGVGTHGDGEIFFHTGYQENPYILLDFGVERTISRIEIRNRTDCCGERALPLNVELPVANGFRLLCQRRAPFVNWTCHPKHLRTRYLRLTHPGSGILHLARISVF